MADSKKSQATKGAGAGKTTGKVPTDVAVKYPDLEALILGTESMTNEERDYWFQILPIMTDEQIQKLLGILTHEKEQLTKLDSEYQSQLKKLDQKHTKEIEEQDRRKKREALKQQEATHEETEAKAQEELLKKLDQ